MAVNSNIKRLMSLNLTLDWTTQRFKSSLGINTPMLQVKNRFRTRKYIRVLVLFGIILLFSIHIFPSWFNVHRFFVKKPKVHTKVGESKSYDAFAKAKWAADSVGRCRQDARQHRIERLCEERVRNGRNICGMWSLKNIMVDDKHKVLYCEVPKAACTSWKMFFAELLGNITDDIRPVLHHKVHRTEVYEQLGFKFLGDFSPEEQLYRIQHYFKFMTVRSPLARIVSAYENKLERQHPDSSWYQKHVGTYIVEHYREKPSAESRERGHDVTFDEFARFVGNKNETFFQRWDRHWAKQFYTCCPCMIKYDYISKIETLAEDSKEIIQRIVPGADITLPRSNVMNLEAESLRVQKKFKLIKDQTLKDLLIHYITDLNMFGYGIDDNRKIFCNSGGDGEDACC